MVRAAISIKFQLGGDTYFSIFLILGSPTVEITDQTSDIAIYCSKFSSVFDSTLRFSIFSAMH